MRLLSILFFLLIAFCNQITAQEPVLKLHSGWKAKKASEVLVDGTVVTSKDFQFYGWMEAVVPGTVLTTLLQNQKVPDPFFGMNNELIPDIYDSGADMYTYWFYNQFSLPELKEANRFGSNSAGLIIQPISI